MYYIIGPVESARAMARKNGLRAGEWVHVGRVGELPKLRFSKFNPLMLTHDWRLLPGWNALHAAVENMLPDGERLV